MPHSKQIFQTSNHKRWQKAKWVGRIFLLLAALLIGALIIELLNEKENLPDIPIGSHATKKSVIGSSENYIPTELEEKYKGFEKLIDDKWKKGKGVGQKDTIIDLSNSPYFPDSTGIRAGFFVNWDPQSFSSLKQNISKLNLVIPEWFFIDVNADTMVTNIDKQAYSIIKSSGVRVMPILSNANYKSSKGEFDGNTLHRILHDEKKKQKLINSIVENLTKNSFIGVNIDFEELKENDNATLTKFQKELYDVLHQKGFLVSQNVSPFNDDYDYKNLAKYNDYLFLMAYDENSEHSKPGPISSQKWIEASVAELTKHISPQKIVLNLAAYGYDWSKDTVSSITYQQALTVAAESDGSIEFDDETYNLHYSYYDGIDTLHQVHFVDAATNFNCMRFATESGLAGVALWRLGSEDQRLWNFYDKALDKNSITDFSSLFSTEIKASTVTDFIGEGEVLDMLATPSTGKVTVDLDNEEMIIHEEVYQKLPSSYVVRKFGKTSKKVLVLTYDDGPDPLYTRQILDTLARYHVPANFFIVGQEAQKNLYLLKRIYREGHEISNHTYTHPNMAEVSRKRALLEIDLTRLLIESVTGHSTIMFRAPFNADSDPEAFEEMQPVAISRTRNYLTIGEAIDPNDWEMGQIPDFNSDTIFNRVLKIYNDRLLNGDSVNIILLHDAGGDRSQTVIATGKIIRHFQALGYKFTTVADLIGKTRDEVMPAVKKTKSYYLIQLNSTLFEIGYFGGGFLYALFLIFTILGAARLLFVGTLAILQKRKEKKRDAELAIHPLPKPTALVSIIVPAYNEELNIVSSVNKLLQRDYENFEIIIVDDGSKDKTLERVTEAFENHPKIKIFTKPNAGKALALNFGISKSTADYFVCIDADTKLAPDAVSRLMEMFTDEKIGAVAGVVKVGNEINMLTKWQSIEYTTSQNFDRKCAAYINAITVVPGAIGAFRREAIEQSGGFNNETLAEDCDITIRMLKAGFVIANQPKALAFTEVPETVGQFMKQRFRWTFGVLQTFWKNKDAFADPKQKGLGFFALPDILLFKYFIPVFTPIADFFMITGIITGNAARIGKFYLLFLLVDLLTGLVAFVLEKEKIGKLIWVIPQRIIYRWIMMVVLIRVLIKAIKGEIQYWGFLRRTGKAKVEA